MSNSDKIYPAILMAMAEIGVIGKNRKNPQQGYQFRGIDEVLNSLQPALIKAKIFIVPRIMSMEQQERTAKSGGALIYTIVRGEYDFVSGEDGSKITASTYGEAMDSGDKSTNKAMSAALKYAVIQTLAIPTAELIDSEVDSHEPAKKPISPPKDEAPKAQREKLFELCMKRWDSRDKSKAFVAYLLEMAGMEAFTKQYISECITDFEARAKDFEEL